MNPEIHLLWKDMLADLSTAAALWELVIIAVACGIAWAIKGALRAYVMRNAPEKWKLGIGGVNRVLFPLTTLIFIQIGKAALSYWQHTGLLHLATILLFSMAIIRLAVYALRYIISPGGLLKTIWLALALHLSGLLADIVQVLNDVKFNIGLHSVNLLLVLQALLTILVTIFIALWISRFIENKLMQAEHVSVNMRVVMAKILRILLLTIALLIALSAVGLDITFLSVFGGALGVGLGFGLQRIASNYVSGFIILLDKSMQLGDVVTIDTHYGVVSDLRTRYLVLRKLDGTEVIIPNETLIINSVINHSSTDRKARVQMPVQVSYDSSLELAMKLMHEISFRHPRVLELPLPAVQIQGFGESGIDLVLNLWIPDPEEGSASLKTEIYLEIWRAFQENNISIPYPQREVRIIGALQPED
jgi:small-conductance mechanosensitive channel